MPAGIMTNKEAADKVAELSSKIRSKGGTPKEFGAFLTFQEAATAVSYLEGQLAGLESRPATPPPLPASPRQPLSAAAQAVYDAAMAKAEAKVAGERAKAAVASLPATPSAAAIKPTKFANSTLEIVMKTALSPLAAAPDRDQAVNELSQRGLTASKEAVTIDRDTFGLLSAETRAAFCRNGGKIVDAKGAMKPDFSHLHGIERTQAAIQWEVNQNASTDTEKAAGSELTFPSQTASPRTAEQFMALGEIARGKIARECEDERNGGTLRQELYDARAKAQAEWKPGDKFSVLVFQQTFNLAFSAVYKFGPECASWEDPAPPITPNAMTARQWIDLSESQVAGMINQLCAKAWGRNVRAELKRAYRNGSSAEKSALKAMFTPYHVKPLEMFKSELI